MKLKYCFLLLSFFVLKISSAQTDTISLPTNIIKYAPFNLLDLNTPAIQFSYEKKLENNAAVQLELGYINQLFYGDFIQPVQGYRAKIELRRYEYWHTRSTNKSYIGGMFLLKQSFREETKFFNRYDGAYREQMTFQKISTGGGLYFTMGKQFFFNDNTSLEIGFAAGLRYVYVEQALDDIPLDAELITSNLFDVNEGSYVFPSFFPVFKLGYCIP